MLYDIYVLDLVYKKWQMFLNNLYSFHFTLKGQNIHQNRNKFKTHEDNVVKAQVKVKSMFGCLSNFFSGKTHRKSLEMWDIGLLQSQVDTFQACSKMRHCGTSYLPEVTFCNVALWRIWYLWLDILADCKSQMASFDTSWERFSKTFLQDALWKIF